LILRDVTAAPHSLGAPRQRTFGTDQFPIERYSILFRKSEMSFEDNKSALLSSAGELAG
jgi:hypothetical protein